jgi:hypothetical protein
MSDSNKPCAVEITYWSDATTLPGTTRIGAVLLSCWDDPDRMLKQIRSLVPHMLDNGCTFISCFGRHAESIHDFIDGEIVAMEMTNARECDAIVVTTFHADESSDEVATFFLNHCHLSQINGRKVLILDSQREEDQELVEAFLSTGA